MAIGFKRSLMTYCPYSNPQEKETGSVPDFENKRQHSINDFWLGRMVNDSAR
jgi:hypothetical protein